MNAYTHALLMFKGWKGWAHGLMVDDGLMDGQMDGWMDGRNKLHSLTLGHE